MSRLALITTICGVKTGHSLTTDIPARGHGLHDEDGGASHANEMEEDGLIPTEFGNRDGWSDINERDEGNNYNWAWPGSNEIKSEMKRVYIPSVGSSYRSYNSGGKYRPGGYKDYNKGGKWSAGRNKRYSSNQFSPIYQKFYPSINKKSDFGNNGVHEDPVDQEDEGYGFFGLKRNGGRRKKLRKGYRRARYFPVFKRKIVDYEDFEKKKQPEKRATGSFGTKYNSMEVSPNYRPPYSKRGGDNIGGFNFLDTILPSYMYSDNGY